MQSQQSLVPFVETGIKRRSKGRFGIQIDSGYDTKACFVPGSLSLSHSGTGRVARHARQGFPFLGLGLDSASFSRFVLFPVSTHETADEAMSAGLYPWQQHEQQRQGHEQGFNSIPFNCPDRSTFISQNPFEQTRIGTHTLTNQTSLDSTKQPTVFLCPFPGTYTRHLPITTTTTTTTCAFTPWNPMSA